MMHLLKNIAPALVLGLGLIGAPPAFGHSLDDLQSMLGDKEKYFQPLHKEAPDFTLRTADGETVGLADLRGKVVVLHFIYAGCPDVCPLHAERIAQIQEMVNQTPMKPQVQFVSITTDPLNDKGEVLRDYGPAHGLDSANWTFLTTKPDQADDATRRLAAAYGHGFTKVEGGYQAHGVVTHVIDKDGRWRANFHGLKFEPANLVAYVDALVNGANTPHAHREQSWWDRLRELF